ncbi:LysR family transcriptional regulator [Alteromonas flava]|uniref:LysR family transcriptional regulator n=1 Tax=Alteromonas flava TaxID=2048003 RepID=UPI001F0BE669|nr:LysR family transcriptional regulator [Alteromonas flava]
MLNLKTLQAFITLADSKTFAEAADKLHITQPALSSSIKRLEESLGGRLFARTTRTVSLTSEGKTFLPAAKRLCVDCDNVLLDIQRLFAVKQGSLTVAAMPSFAEGALPPLIKQFNRDFPNIRFRILDVVMESVIDCVLSGRTEIGFSFEPEHEEGLIFEPLFEDKFIAIVSAEHSLASRKSLSWATILQQPFIAMNRDSSVRLWLQEVADRLNLPINLIAEANQLSTVGQLVTTGMGVSVVPMLCRRQMLAKGLVCIELEEDLLVRPVGMLKAKRGTLSVPAQTFWLAVKNQRTT